MFIWVLSVAATATSAACKTAAADGAKDDQGQDNEPQSFIFKNFAQASHSHVSFSYYIYISGLSPGVEARRFVCASDTII